MRSSSYLAASVSIFCELIHLLDLVAYVFAISIVHDSLRPLHIQLWEHHPLIDRFPSQTAIVRPERAVPAHSPRRLNSLRKAFVLVFKKLCYYAVLRTPICTIGDVMRHASRRFRIYRNPILYSYLWNVILFDTSNISLAYVC